MIEIRRMITDEQVHCSWRNGNSGQKKKKKMRNLSTICHEKDRQSKIAIQTLLGALN
jgi:hypothetical protein